MRANNALQGRVLSNLRKAGEKKAEESQIKRGRLKFARSYSTDDIEEEEAENAEARRAKESCKVAGRKRGRPAGSKNKAKAGAQKAQKQSIMLRIPARTPAEPMEDDFEGEILHQQDPIAGYITSETDGSDDSDIE
ncbi:MAG: hypothetical protein CYPHOPRED_004874 [Cyphobasidiales sp. Tagirdzhanova-0007]|nr:MAG: hypothetical protein CYPHOPRED_004874 [Cyphobasidiales sp. Tagirdzhanova-0007]